MTSFLESTVEDAALAWLENLGWTIAHSPNSALDCCRNWYRKSGWYNPLSGKLSYAVIHRTIGRIYGLDLGADHRNPGGDLVGEKHKHHHWKEDLRDREAYVPEDITEPWNRPVEVWKQFCNEANLRHSGIMHEPTSMQGGMLL